MVRIGFLVTLLFHTAMHVSFAQTIKRLEPPNWWVGMQRSELQLMVYGDGISEAQVGVDYPGVILTKTHRVENPNYLFLDLTIAAETHPGSFDISFTFPNQQVLKYPYTLKERREGSALRQGFDASDVVYLLFPDRFANGNPTNDVVNGMSDPIDRSDLNARHGGDIQGIIDHLEYLTELGITAIWVNPLLECNQPWHSYHGYACTDLYQIDARHGTNELYRKFVHESHRLGLKVIKDLVFNHVGDRHWWIADLPSADWLNQWPDFTRSNYRIPAIFDPYASANDKKLMEDGWFDTHMPDLNQRNPFLANYLIQNSIWWIEEADLDGIRMDTYPYPEKQFMARWSKAVMDEYPNFNIVAETWVNYPAWTAYWQKGANNRDGYDSQVPTVMDFPLMFAMQKAFDEKESWDTGLLRLYEILAHDFLYENPMNIMIFPDNHDVSRFMKEENMALGRFKLCMAFLLTTRGIPQLYYGTELLMAGNDTDGHGVLRKDFPGGWPNDKRSAFTAQGRTKRENEAWNYLSTLLHWRRNAKAIQSGKLMHFIPDNEVYVYFRLAPEQSVMVVLNNGYQPKVLKTGRFQEVISNFKMGTDIISGKKFSHLDSIRLSPRSALIIELK